MIEALENELLAGGGALDRAQLAVYADALQASRDPARVARGELMALDLHAEVHGTTPEGDAHRAELVTAWLGGDLAGDPIAQTPLGFLELRVAGREDWRDQRRLTRLLDHDATRSVSIRGDVSRLRTAVTALSARPQRWLRRLSITLNNPHAGPALPRRLTDALIAATPNLDELEVEGSHAIGMFPHLTLRRLRVTGFDAIALDGKAFPLPRLVELDLAFAAPGPVPYGMTRAVLRELLPLARFPALRHLDLSRCEPGSTAPRNLGAEADPYVFLGDGRIRSVLERVTMPSLRWPAQLASLRAALVWMPALVELHVARSYRSAPSELPARVTAAPPVPWPAHDDAGGLLVVGAGTGASVSVPLASLVVALELAHDRLVRDAAAWAHWTTLWDLVCSTHGHAPVPFDLLDRACASIAGELTGRGKASELLTLLAAHRDQGDLEILVYP